MWKGGFHWCAVSWAVYVSMSHSFQRLLRRGKWSATHRNVSQFELIFGYRTHALSSDKLVWGRRKDRRFRAWWNRTHILNGFWQGIPTFWDIIHEDSTQLFGLFWESNPITFAKMSDMFCAKWWMIVPALRNLQTWGKIKIEQIPTWVQRRHLYAQSYQEW